LTDAHYAYNATAAIANQQPVATANVATATANVSVTASQPAAKVVTAETTQAAGTLYAQPTANGYHLIDTAPKIILTLLRTSAEDYFIADNGSSNGIVFKKNDNWFFEYYKDGKLIAEKLLIKF